MTTTLATKAETTLEVDADTARRWAASGDTVIVDVREADERAAEWIEGSTSIPLSSFDPGPLLATGADRKVVFHCRGGRRSLDALGRYRAAGGLHGFSMAGGLDAWKRAAMPVERGKAPPISLMRQVQIVIGFMVLVGCALTLWLNPWFLIMPAFFGAGLLFAGISGTCGLASVLSAMPWNRFDGPTSSCSV
jgi:rhodanese-related sulfurtransferase